MPASVIFEITHTEPGVKGKLQQMQQNLQLLKLELKLMFRYSSMKEIKLKLIQIKEIILRE